MKETNDMLCELSLMYAVVRGMCAIVEEDHGKLSEGSSFERGAVDCGIWWLRDRMDELWPQLRIGG